LRSRLQPALVDAGRGASGPQGLFVVPVLARVLGTLCCQTAHSRCDSRWQSVPGGTICHVGARLKSLKVDFAGPTKQAAQRSSLAMN